VPLLNRTSLTGKVVTDKVVTDKVITESSSLGYLLLLNRADLTD
jgi:hypothetical protein